MATFALSCNVSSCFGYKEDFGTRESLCKNLYIEKLANYMGCMQISINLACTHTAQFGHAHAP